MGSYIDRHFVELNEHSVLLPGAEQGSPQAALVVHVIYTDPQGTLAALQAAEALASQLQARITLLAAHAVPYHLPLNSPPISIQFAKSRLIEIAQQGQLHTSIEIYICRDRTFCLFQALTSKSVVILGARKRWWPSKDIRLAKRLRSAGHQVILIQPRSG
jgi:hypothetical protein